MRETLHSLEEVRNIAKEINAKNIIITHIEEDWGKSYDDYKELEKSYDNIIFAHDGMIIDL